MSDLRREPATGLSPSGATRLLSKLESDPHLITAHWNTLEHLIASCTERIYRAEDDHDKMMLVAVEYRPAVARACQGMPELMAGGLSRQRRELRQGYVRPRF